MEELDDLLGPLVNPPVSIYDLLGPVPRKQRKRNATKSKMTYKPLAPPADPQPGGIWRMREKKGQNLGRTCMFCNEVLKSKGGRPPVICGARACFRAYRNAYRLDYDKARS